MVGDAVGYPRGTPLLASVEALAHRFVGTDVTMRRGTCEAAFDAFVNGRPAFVRALSLFDIALWDLAAKAAELPLFRLLGGARTQVPAMAVGGYYLQDRSIDDVSREIGELVQGGHQRVKIMLLGTDAQFDRKYVEAVSKVADGRLAVDAHWSWKSVPQALRTCTLIDDAGLLFIEDPFGAHQWPLACELQQHLKTPIALGEDMPDEVALFRLTEKLSILRVDATTCGGIGPASNVIGAASLRGAAIVPHVFAPLHAQLAGAFSSIEVVEYIPESTGADPMGCILQRGLSIRDGIVNIDEEPGAGFALDWEKVGQFAVQTFQVGA